MTALATFMADEQIRNAVEELKMRIAEKFDVVEFNTYVGEDPEGVYLRVVVDLDETDVVSDHIIDRLVEMQLDEELPIHVIPERTWARNIAMIEHNRRIREQRDIA